MKTITIDFDSYKAELAHERSSGETHAWVNIVHYLESRFTHEQYFEIYGQSNAHYLTRLRAIKEKLMQPGSCS